MSSQSATPPSIVLGFSWKKAKVVSQRLPGTDEENAPDCCCCGARLPAMALLDDKSRWWGRDCYRRAAGLPVYDRSGAARDARALKAAAVWLLKWADKWDALPSAIRMRPHSLGWDWVWSSGRRVEGGRAADEHGALLRAAMVIAIAVDVIVARDAKERANQAVVDEHGDHMYGSMVWPKAQRVRVEDVQMCALRVDRT